MLAISGLRSGYSGMEILHGIDMAVKPDEIVAIIGPNGSGKSTILKSVFNLCDIYSGKIGFKGKDITKLPTHELVYEGIGYVPQGRQVFGDLTVRENLEMGAYSFSDRGLRERNALAVFRKFPFLKDRQKDYAFTLSGGQQQMLAIARALMRSPDILLMDEPSLGLAPKVMKEVFAKVLEINREGTSVVIVEQNARQAVEISDRTYVLDGGRVAMEGGRELLKDRHLKNVYFGG